MSGLSICVEIFKVEAGIPFHPGFPPPAVLYLARVVRLERVLERAAQLLLVVHVDGVDVRLPDELLRVRVLTRQLRCDAERARVNGVQQN